MKYVRGKYVQAQIFTDNIEDAALQQVQILTDMPFMDGEQLRLMPDVHAGKGCTVGTVMTINNGRICPNLVGVDIGCGMLVARLKNRLITEDTLKRLDEVIHTHIPAGRQIHETPVYTGGEYRYTAKVDVERAKLSLGTLGGGNHFIELARGEDLEYYLIIHTGSRHLGVEVANFWQKEAIAAQTRISPVYKEAVIEAFKLAGRQNEISQFLKDWSAGLKADAVPEELAYLEGDKARWYLNDMYRAQDYAHCNRLVILESILHYMDWNYDLRFETVHNYIDTQLGILRKGAVSALDGEQLIIPMNMRDGSLLCTGKGNPDWLYSAPHGAGRLMSRSQARKQIEMKDFEKSMEGIYTTSVLESTIDESPMAYKPMDEIINNIKYTVNVEQILKPVYNFKAGD